MRSECGTKSCKVGCTAVWVLPRNAVAAVRVGISRGVIGGLIGVVVVCLGSFRVGNLGKWVKSRVLGHIDAG
jgi:hypothetical protein